MTSFNEYLTQGNAWLFIPAAIVLGALHGLEPGHSKTMMAAFIVAIRGTVKQAVLLGLSATISHTAVIWVLAFVGLHYSGKFDPERTEPYFQAVAGVMVVGMAAWMFARTRREIHAAHHHHHHHGHGHSDEDQPRGVHGGPLLETGTNEHMEISVFETNVPPRFRLYAYDGAQQALPWPAGRSVTLETNRPDGAKQVFEFKPQGDFLESTSDIPEPHEFQVTLSVVRDGGSPVTYRTHFEEDHHHPSRDPESEDFEDAHEREHAAEIEKRFTNRNVTNGQLILFGLTGGLMPCPAAFAVLLICLQLKKFTLGFALVVAFSLGLAITLVGVGAIAAISLRHASKRFKGFGEIARRAPYISSAVMAAIGIVVAVQGLRHLMN
ncbi:nickel/cobalt efflux protein RcnA [bacterium]|nr:nickel/cobalt efflux protein RcnA [bacterium]